MRKLIPAKAIVSTGLMALASMSAFATTSTTGAAVVLNQISKPIEDLINSMLTPLLAIVVAIGSLFCVILGVKYAKAEEPQDREKAKAHLKSAVIGFVLIFVLMLALRLLSPVLQQWVITNSSTTAAK